MLNSLMSSWDISLVGPYTLSETKISSPGLHKDIRAKAIPPNPVPVRKTW